MESAFDQGGCREHTEWRVPEIERKLRELPTEEVDIDGLKLLIKSFINELDPPLSDFAEVGMQGVVETDKVKTKMICWIEARILLRGKIPYNTERLPSTPSPVLQPATPLTLKRPLVDVEEVNEDELRLMQASAIKVEEVKEDRPNLLKASPVVHDDTEEINDTIEVKIGEPARK
ncbi:hypothetical protein PMZ80_010452 [Knufia obscura]|uniref:Uncharacterized protein n=1 Tax=Knufia obscura TaxID=1635080 RepID=A0ABR0RB16_9EURO|nr:hypothetical protein PMZ80_010452 [Knufia obscura]